MRNATLAGIFGLWLVGLSSLNAANTQYGPIKPGDSLWAIAKTLRPNTSISVEKMAQLLFEHNPDAFIKNNKSQLKPGAMLYVPSSLVAARDSKTKAAANSAKNEESAKTKTLNSKESAKALQQAQALIAQLQGENKQLQSRLDSLADVEGKLQSLQQKLSYKEDQLQALRKELKALPSPPTAESKPLPQPVPPPVSSSEVSTPEVSTPEVSVIEPSPDATPVPVVTADPAVSTQNTLIVWLAAAGAGLIGMGLLGLLWRRRNSATAAEADEEGYESERLEDRNDGPSVESLDQLLTQADIEFAKQNFKSSKAMLQRAKALDTADPEIRLRLLEVLHRLQEVAGFESEAKALHHLVQDETSPIWQQVVALGQDLNSPHPLFANQSAVTVRDIEEEEADATDPAIADFGSAALDEEDIDHEMLPPSEISDLGLDDVGYLFQEGDFMADDGMDALAPETDGMDDGAMAAQADFDPLEAVDEVPAPKMSALDDEEESAALALSQEAGFGPAFDPAEDLVDPSVFAAAAEGGNQTYQDAIADEVGTKLELAQAFLDMGDSEQARSILQEVIQDGTVSQQQQANTMMAQL